MPSCVVMAEICVRCSVEWVIAWTIRLASLYSISSPGSRSRTLVSSRAESANWSSSSLAQRAASFNSSNPGTWPGESGWGRQLAVDALHVTHLGADDVPQPIAYRTKAANRRGVELLIAQVLAEVQQLQVGPGVVRE